MFEKPIQNKMMQAAPVKKEFHFAATAEHYAEVVYAATIQEAENLYHNVKRPISTNSAPSELPPAPPAPLSTPAPASEEESVQ